MAVGVPQQVVDAANDRVSGATPIARAAVDGLLTVAGDPDALARAVQVLRDGQPAMAPVWHVGRAATTVQPARSLSLLRARLDEEFDQAVAAAVAWLAARGGSVRTASSSSLVDAVLPLLPPTD